MMYYLYFERRFRGSMPYTFVLFTGVDYEVLGKNGYDLEKNMKILVVDDKQMMRDSVCATLSRGGLTSMVSTVTSADSAIAALTAAECGGSPAIRHAGPATGVSATVGSGCR